MLKYKPFLLEGTLPKTSITFPGSHNLGPRGKGWKLAGDGQGRRNEEGVVKGRCEELRYEVEE